jgi:hypothetical protein
MSNFKDDFVENTVISKNEMNQNFNRLNNLFVFENLTAQVDGIKTQFSTSQNYMPGNLIVFVDGLAATPVDDIQEDGTNKFTTLFADILETGVKLVVFYIRKF